MCECTHTYSNPQLLSVEVKLILLRKCKGGAIDKGADLVMCGCTCTYSNPQLLSVEVKLILLRKCKGGATMDHR